MRLRVRLDGRRPRRWHASLLARAAAAATVEIDARPGPDDWPANADLLFAIESLVYRLPQDGPAAREPDLARWPQAGPAAPDLILDLCGDVEAVSVPVWRLSFDGRPGEAGLLASLLDGRAPVATLDDGARSRAAGRLGTERRGVVRASFEDALRRTVELVAAALAGREAGGPALPAPPLPGTGLTLARVGARAAGYLVRGIGQRLYHLCVHAPHWRTGWRRLDGPDLIDLRRHPDSGWRVLPDDGRRYYADPFPIEHGGRTFVFVEEYVHAAAKGLVSAVAFGPDGPLGTPRPVLEEAHHLSYPFVFARDGEVWMVPESCSAGTIDLYRATAFPGGWTREATLVSGLTASDATLVEHGGLWWMFATVRDGGGSGGGSYSDALHLWSAPDFRGPWTPHAHNPVLVDIATARPAGRVVARGGALIRPFQDCTTAYGRALGLARIERLDAGGYRQSVETVLGNGPAWPGSRIHTLNSAGGIECIDGSASASRLRARLAR